VVNVDENDNRFWYLFNYSKWSPGRVFHYKRGVRQGDPLYPLLFVLAADLLQSIVNSAKQRGILNLPLPTRYGTDFPIVQRPYDTLLVLEARPRQLLALKALLHTFVESTGLKVNNQKSYIYPINVSDEKMSILSITFGYHIGSFLSVIWAYLWELQNKSGGFPAPGTEN
jgi:hypothetical protein